MRCTAVVGAFLLATSAATSVEASIGTAPAAFDPAPQAVAEARADLTRRLDALGATLAPAPRADRSAAPRGGLAQWNNWNNWANWGNWANY